MRKIKLLLLTPAILIAGEIDLSTIYNKGQSTYIVQLPSQGLKSKLDFPFKFYSGNIKYKHSFELFDFAISASTILDDNSQVGKDYDWQNDNLTVYSESQNSVDNYYEINFELSKEIINKLRLFTSFKYSQLDYIWRNTNEIDYVSNTNSFAQGNTLTYEQEFYQYNLGVSYEAVFNDIKINFIPSIIYSNVKTKDTHILRNFYTTQDTDAFGYSIKGNLTYKINNNSSFGIFYEYEKLKDNNVEMKYFNNLGNYMSLPSSYKFKNSKLGIKYIYSF